MTDPFTPSDDEHLPDEQALDNLDAFVSSLDTGKKRKAEDDDVQPKDSSARRKRRLLKARTEAGTENEFGVHAASGSKLRLEDLLDPLDSSSSLQALKKSTKALAKGDALLAPLPTRTQDRIDRAAAYEQTKEEVDKWHATMKRIKEADHLSFPLQVPQKIQSSNAGLASKFQPSNEMESAVDALLRKAKLKDELDIQKTEELELNHLSVEEVAQRRAELRKMRELMFREEVKAKRAAKIKSKAYRKIQKKSKEKMKALLDEAEGAEEDEEDAQLRHEVERALERATLKHKKTGKWAKAMMQRGELEVSQRKAIEEMLEKGEKLRAKIQGEKGDGEESSDEDSDESEEEEEAPQGISATTRRERMPSPVIEPVAGGSSNPWLQPRPAKKETTKQTEKITDAPLILPESGSSVKQGESSKKGAKSGNAAGVKAFEQRDLVAMAFAGDDVVQDFAKLKKREIERDAPREEDKTLPGWGSWGGRGVKQNPNAKKVVKKIAGVDPTNRADHGKPHVIISEKKDKKAAKYQVKDLPYPYTSKAQFERSMETPVGTEWNTRVGFQRATLPRVVKKMGTVIDPLEKIF